LKTTIFRKSFTILELVVVMTITGVMIGSTFQMFMNIYQSYSYLYEMNSLDFELSNASMKIVRYLENRAYDSVIDSNDTNFTVLSSNYILDKNSTLQWVGKALDTYNGTWNSSKSRVIPNWSGFLDLTKNHNTTTLYTDSNSSRSGIFEFDTDISQAEDIIFNLSDGDVNISKSGSNFLPAIFFRGGTSNDRGCFGWEESILGDTNSSECAFIGHFEANSSDNIFKSKDQVNGFGNNVKDLKIYEQYLFSWTAYGLKVEYSNTTKSRNLYFYYNYRPWNGDNMEDNGTRTILLRNVTKFKYSSNGSTLILEICIKDKNSNEIVFCRESIVY